MTSAFEQQTEMHPLTTTVIRSPQLLACCLPSNPSLLYADTLLLFQPLHAFPRAACTLFHTSAFFFRLIHVPTMRKDIRPRSTEL